MTTGTVSEDVNLTDISFGHHLNALKNELLNDDVVTFLFELSRKFETKREELLTQRIERQGKFELGKLPNFLNETKNIRSAQWQVAKIPLDLEDRRVEITGPAEPKMIINALNSGANVFMADFEDSLSPTWKNILIGQKSLKDAVSKKLKFQSSEGKLYELNSNLATLVVRPRGWHLVESNFLIDSKPISASLFDFGVYFFHNVKELMANKSGAYFYLPKLESHLEARLWADIFAFAESYIGIEKGSIRATILIETILAAFEMEEILYELREYASGLNAGRWDYLFSLIKKLAKNKQLPLLPDRSLLTMNTSFMRAYARLLVQTCHKRKAHAIGGMSAFVPNRKDEDVNQKAFFAVELDKRREALDGFDGTWVAHPDLVIIARAEFDKVFGDKQNQKHKLLDELEIKQENLLDFSFEQYALTKEGVYNNVDVALRYIDSWLSGIGAAAIYNLMEDAATAEIARAQLWQWLKYEAKVKLTNSDQYIIFDTNFYNEIKTEVLVKLSMTKLRNLEHAVQILDKLVLTEEFLPFLTLVASDYLVD